MIRHTSIVAYNRIKEEGLLSLRRWQVYDILYAHGPMTANECFIEWREKYGKKTINNANIVTRLGELRDMGVVEEMGTRSCGVSTQTVLVWDVTANLPKAYKRAKKIKCEHCDGLGYIIEESKQ